MARVISIEIGQALTKICVMNYKEKNPRVYKSITIETPNGVISDGMLNPRESYVQLLRDTFAKNKIKEKRLVFSIASNRIASREVTIPYVNPKRISEVLHANAEEYFPVDLSEYRIAHTVLGVLGEGKDRSYKVLVLAVPEQILEGYFDIARMLGMEISSIDYAGNSLLQATKRSCQDGTNMIVKIDGHSTMLMVISDGIMTSFRSIPYGVNEVVRAVQKGIGSSNYLGAVEELQRHTYIGNSQWEDVIDLEAMEDIGSALEMLVNGISRVVDFHNSKPENTNIEKVMLTGVGGSFGGMSVLVQERLGIFTVPLENVEGLVVPREFVDNTLGNYVGCIGASMQPLDLVTVFKTKKSKQGAPKTGDNVIVPAMLGAGGVIIGLALLIMAYIPYNEAKSENRRLNNKVQQLLPVEDVRNTYVQTQTLWNQVHTMYNMTANDNDRLVAFIEELEVKMPSEIIVLSMSSNATGVTLNVEVGSKQAAAKVLQQLRDFESILVLDTATVTDTKVDGTSRHTVSFSVNCVYSGVVTNMLNEAAAQVLANQNVEAAEAE